MQMDDVAFFAEAINNSFASLLAGAGR
jgi:hypothetical protein